MEVETDVRAVLSNLHGIDLSHGRLFHLVVTAEAPEVMLPDEVRSSLPHRCEVRVLLENRDILPLEDRLLITVPAAVAVGLAGRLEAAVKAICAELQLVDADIIREVLVHVAPDLLFCFIGIEQHIGGHRTCMHPGVGPSRADDGDREGSTVRCLVLVAVDHAGQYLLELSLDRELGVRLVLPAIVAGTVVA